MTFFCALHVILRGNLCLKIKDRKVVEKNLSESQSRNFKKVREPLFYMSEAIRTLTMLS